LGRILQKNAIFNSSYPFCGFQPGLFTLQERDSLARRIASAESKSYRTESDLAREVGVKAPGF
jgi:hypothetical protein